MHYVCKHIKIHDISVQAYTCIGTLPAVMSAMRSLQHLHHPKKFVPELSPQDFLQPITASVHNALQRISVQKDANAFSPMMAP